MKKKIAVLIPAKDEERGIGKVIAELPKGVDIYVIDGLSKDKTMQVAKSFGAKVINEKRLGYGRAYKTGFSKVPRSAKYVACLDADGTYPASRVTELVNMLEKEKLDFISCQRILDGNMCLKHKIGNKVLTIATNMLFGVHIKDSQSGMWVFRRKILDEIKMESDGMAFSEELKIRAATNGFRFREVPIEYRERIGEVKLKSNEDGIKNLIYLFKLRMSL
ncbi:MAG: glycosyltransferase family 2 protein [Nanoarchaeota archaeon]|nr:glycosyltransferase family 2 protein [Nanoarchaeota archaeon]MBU4300809.1 glycosyltransferase family 2 protein [Nanoarchaeota archaeon]MBU4451484.1 glycosyltransferase family 2 protein [Nanoarchaeota archaeon]MCG2723865.1 glycosyltransferase family 2 protein [archaeon]